LQIYKSSQVELHCFIKTILQNIFWKSSDISEYYKLALYEKSQHSQDKNVTPTIKTNFDRYSLTDQSGYY